MSGKDETRFRNLTLSLLLLILASPFLASLEFGRLVGAAILTLVFYFGVVALSDRKAPRMAALALAVPWFVLEWGARATEAPPLLLDAAANALAVGFFALTAAVILLFLIQARRVTSDVLWGAVAGYVMLGALWYALYALIGAVDPEAFFNGFAGVPAERPDLLYYSFVTLTTLGYGDIVPVHPVARNVAVLQALAGTMYLPIVLSRLVALFIAQSEAERAG